jgi:carbon-monoxide dehydrogenase medium subunit
MYPASFEYHRPSTLEEAIGLLSEHGEDAKLLAGGHSLIPLMKFRLTQPAHLIDMRRIDGLKGIRQEQDAVVIGALTTHYQIESSDALKSSFPILAEAAAKIGDPQVRNLGTIGGSLAHADPAADWPALVLALGAELHIVGPTAGRVIPADEFFVDLLTTSLAPDEVLAEVRFPLPPASAGAAYEKHTHAASRFAVCGVAALVVPGDGGTCREARVAVTGVGPKATRARGVEEALAGKKLDAQSIAAAAEKGADGIDITADLQGSVEYKAHLARVYTRRALEKAAGRAQGKTL